MSERRKRDMTSLHSLDAATAWFRGQSGALLILAIRAEDVSIALDPAIKPKDAIDLVEAAMPEVTERLEEARKLAKEMDAVRKGFEG